MRRDRRASRGRPERGAGGWKCFVEGQPSAEEVSASEGAARPTRWRPPLTPRLNAVMERTSVRAHGQPPHPTRRDAGPACRVRGAGPVARPCARGAEPGAGLRGEAGIGKSALLEYLLDAASGCRTARTAGVESEMELAFAGSLAVRAVPRSARASARSPARAAQHGDIMYVQGTGNALVALDASTGKQLWSHPNQGAIGARGLNYWESPDRSDRRLLYLNAGHLTAIDAGTGEFVASFGTNGRVDLRNALRRPAAQPAADEQPGTRLRRHRHHLAAGPGGRLRLDAGRRAGLRRADGQGALGVPQHPAPGRVRLRHLAARARSAPRAASTTGAS